MSEVMDVSRMYVLMRATLSPPKSNMRLANWKVTGISAVGCRLCHGGGCRPNRQGLSRSTGRTVQEQACRTDENRVMNSETLLSTPCP